MLRYAIAILLCVAGPLYADNVIWTGDIISLVNPNFPLPSSTPYELTLGYGEESNTIGDWYTEPGVYDLSSDPGLSGFLSFAANGIDDILTIGFTDNGGYKLEVDYEESFVFQVADLSSLPVPVTGVLLNLIRIEDTGVSMGWQFLGVPEPTTLPLLLLGAGLVRRRGRRWLGY